jgi:hypothetical protein
VFKRNVVVRRPNPSTAAAQGLVLHPRPARQAGVDRDHPRPRRAPCTRSTTCALTAATRWSGRNTRSEEILGELPCVLLQVPRLALRPGRQGQRTSPTSSEFFDLDKAAADAAGALRGVGRVHLHQPGRRPGTAARASSATDCCPSRRYPFEKMTQRYGFSRADQRQLEARRRLASASGTTRRTCTAVSSTRTSPRPRRWCRPSTPTTTTCSARTCSPRSPGRRRCRPRTRHRRDRPARTSAGSTSFSAQAFSVPTTFPTSGSKTMEPISSTAANIASWGNDQFWLFPNISVQIWARGYYITYTYWPESVDSHIYEIDLYFVPPANAPSGWRRNWWSTAPSSSPCRT